MFEKKVVKIEIKQITIEGELTIPENAKGIVLFAHGSGSSRFSPRNNFVAEVLQKAGLATLLVDLLTVDEDENYDNRFNINLLADRLTAVTEWLKENDLTKSLKIFYFGASTGAAAAIKAAAKEKNNVSAIVSRGGRVDLAGKEILEIDSPILLIVGGHDDFVLELSDKAYLQIIGEKKLSVIPCASHLFEEKGTLEEVANQARDWFIKYLA